MTKTVNTRDAATSTLRKIGVNVRDYNLFITKVGEKFEVNVELATKHVADVTEQTSASDIVEKAKKRNAANTKRLVMNLSAPQMLVVVDHAPSDKKIAAVLAATKEKPAKKIKASIVQVDKPETISQVCRRMILAGATNAQVWEYIQPTFNCDGKKRGYAAWFRTELKNKGLLAK